MGNSCLDGREVKCFNAIIRTCMYMPPSKIECVDNDKHMTLLFWCHISCADFALPFLWAHKSSLTPSFFFEVPVSSNESMWQCICVLGVSILILFLRFVDHNLELF